MKFTVALIAKNEEETLPRLLKSIKGVDEVIVVDTGSTDKTVEVAKSFGATVYEEKFNILIDEELKKGIDEIIGENDIKVGDTAFNFAEARNWIAQKAKHDMIFMPDCDEIVEWDIPAVEKLLDTGIDRLEYNFVFSWDNDGNPLIQFIHSKFYNRTKLHWVRVVHEVLEGEGKSQFTDKIFLKHYQNEKTNRGQYLKGLAIDCIRNEYNDRNCHYLARELYYTGHYPEAIKMFKEHIAKPGWITEKGQSVIFMGDCYKAMGDRQKAMEYYARAFTYDMKRREPLISLAGLKYEDEEWIEAERLYRLALMIPKSNYYANWAPNYSHYPWGQLSVCLYKQGRMEESKQALEYALQLDPNNTIYQNNMKLYPAEDDLQFTGERVVVDKMNDRPDILIEHLARYKFAKKYVKNRKVLDASCGSGYGKLEMIPKKYFGVDIDEKTISYANKKYGNSYFIENLENGINNKYDIDTVVSFETIEHLENPNNLLNWVKDNSDLFIFSIPINMPSEFHKVVYSEDDIKNLIKKYFINIELFGQRGETIKKELNNPQYIVGIASNKSLKDVLKDEYPKVSIVIPTLGREEKLKKLLETIKENADYPNYEVIVMKDTFENRKGVPKLVKKGVDFSTGELVMYLANDVIPQPGFLKLAVKKMYDTFGKAMDGLVGLNDMYWYGEFATHWLASKKLLPYLGGEFFHTGYHHNGCDNELTERCRKINRYVWAEEAKIFHDHPIRKDFKGEIDEVHKIARSFYKKDRALLKRRAKELNFELRENFIHPNIKLSAVIPFKNNVVMTYEAMESLIQNTDSLGEIIVIDDNSIEDIKLYIKKLKKYGIPIIYQKNKKGGVNAAWNLGASLAKFPYVAILNNDILFSKDWEKPLYNALDDEIWLVSPYHTYGDLPEDFPNGKERHKNIKDNAVGLPFIGSCFMMKKENINRIMPIDERLKIWCGDNFIYEMIKTDFGRQAKEVEASYIHHFGKKTVKGILKGVIEEEKKIFDKIIQERNWENRKDYCPMIPPIDLRLKLPIKDLHKMKVLNVGVGDMTSGLARQLPYLNFKQLDHIDIHEPYFERAKAMDWTCKNVNFIKADVKDYDFSDYDLVMIFDVLEHLEKEDSLKVIKRFNKVLVFLPLEEQFRDNPDGAKSQDHLSLWTEMDFIMLGFKTTVLNNFHSDAKGNVWSALWGEK